MPSVQCVTHCLGHVYTADKMRRIDLTLLKTKDQIIKGSTNTLPMCGIYFLIRDSCIVYVGRSRNILGRIGQHLKNGRIPFDSYSYIECDEDQIGALEIGYINSLSPPMNGHAHIAKPEGNLECGWCGKVVARKRMQQIYCSNNCRQSGYLQRKAESLIDSKIGRKCIICGVKLRPKYTSDNLVLEGKIYKGDKSGLYCSYNCYSLRGQLNRKGLLE